jgi:pectate lyase
MQAPQSFIVTPKFKRYKSGKQMGDKVFETVTSIEDAKDVSKEGIVIAVPLNYNGEIEVGDEVIIHHNIFRSYYDQMGKLKYSRAHLFDDYFQAIPEELFLYKKEGEWIPNIDFCFVEPVHVDEDSILDQKLEHTGVIYVSSEHPTGMKIGFTPESEYEVFVDGNMYYRMRNIDVCVYIREEE